MSTLVKINGINRFINKFETSEKVIDINTFIKNFELDKDVEDGFYKLSFSEKKVTMGGETINYTYNRPPIGPIEMGFYCPTCNKVGNSDHREDCIFPDDANRLNLTFLGFYNKILSNINYSGDYSSLKDAILSKQVTQEELDDILIIPGTLSAQDLIDEDINSYITSNANVKTNISNLGIYKKRGPKKLVSKTQTTQFLNNVLSFILTFLISLISLNNIRIH